MRAVAPFPLPAPHNLRGPVTPIPKPTKPEKEPPKRIKRGQPIPRSSRPARKTKPARQRKAPIARLKRKLDTLFSKYIKDRDGLVCITCKKTVEPQNINCGHFIGRTRQSLRWDPKNSHSQCASPCNYHRRGAPAEYALAIIDRYGVDELKRLMARKLVDKHWTRPELVALIEPLERGDGATFEAMYYEQNL